MDKKIAILPLVLLVYMAVALAQPQVNLTSVAGDYVHSALEWNGTGNAQNTTIWTVPLPNSTYNETVTRFNVLIGDIDSSNDFNVNVTVDGVLIAINKTVPHDGILTLNALDNTTIDPDTDNSISVKVLTLNQTDGTLLNTEHTATQEVSVENVTTGYSVNGEFVSDPFVAEDEDNSYYTVENYVTLNNTNNNFTLSNILVELSYPSDARNIDSAIGTNYTVASLDYNKTSTTTIGYQAYGPYIVGKSIDEGTENVMEFRVKSPRDFNRVDFYLNIDDYSGFFPQFNTDTLSVEVNGRSESFDIAQGSTIIKIENFDLDAGSNTITLTWTPSTVPTPPVPSPIPDFWNTPYGPFTGMQWVAIALVALAIGLAIYLLAK